MHTTNSEFGFRHIAIAGISFCGSTLLSMILGSLKGVHNIGESHKLIVNLEMTSETPGSDKAQPSELIKDCKSCGEVCDIYTLEFRHALRDDPSEWYKKIAAQRGSTVLVSSDKNYQRLISKDPLLNLDAIVLFKSPQSATNSFYRKFIDPKFTAHKSFDFEYVIRAWLNSYKNFLYNFDNTGQKLFLDFEQFQNNPDFHMSALCNFLKLKYDSSCLQTLAKEQHYFGGNSRVNKPYKNNKTDFKISRPDATSLPEKYIDEISNNSELTAIHKELMVRYRDNFSNSTTVNLAEEI